MKLHLVVGAVFVTSFALLGLGACTDDTGSSTSSNTASSSSSSGETSTSSSGSSGASSSSSASSSGSSGASGSSSTSGSSGSGMYQFCSDCTNNGMTGAYAKECKNETQACLANADCQTLATCSYDKCPANGVGGCCTFQCIKDNNTPPAAQTLFFAMDNCVYCKTCASLCAPDAADYCKVTMAMGAGCP